MSSPVTKAVKVTYRRSPRAPLIAITQPGRLRFANLMALLNVSHQTVYSRIKTGDIPPPDGYDGRLPFWYTESVRPLLERQLP